MHDSRSKRAPTPKLRGNRPASGNRSRHSTNDLTGSSNFAQSITSLLRGRKVDIASTFDCAFSDSDFCMPSAGSPRNLGQPRPLQQKVKTLTMKQQKSRISLQSEEQEAFSDIVRRMEASAVSICSFSQFRDVAMTNEEAAAKAKQLWAAHCFEDAVRHIECEEQEAREAIRLRAREHKRTLEMLFYVDGHALFQQRAVDVIVEAERVRREYLYRQEITAALELNISEYRPTYIGMRGAVGQKIDYMAASPCPYRYAEDCPYYPSSVLRRPCVRRVMFARQEERRHQLIEQSSKKKPTARSSVATLVQSSSATSPRAASIVKQEPSMYGSWRMQRRLKKASEECLSARTAVALLPGQLPSVMAAGEVVCCDGTGSSGSFASSSKVREGCCCSSSTLPTITRRGINQPVVAVDGGTRMTVWTVLRNEHYLFSESCLVPSSDL